MKLPNGIRDNLGFLRIEVDSQIENLQAYFDNPSKILAARIFDRKGYIYNLKTRIHDTSLQQIAVSEGDAQIILPLRCAEFVATDLERITELCRDCVTQAAHLQDFDSLRAEAYGPMLERVRDALEMLEPAIIDNDTRQALKIGQIEAHMDRDYRKLMKRYINTLKEKKKRAEDIATALFIARSVEQMGDALLDISEAIVSAVLGQPLNMDRLHSLRTSGAIIGSDLTKGQFKLDTIAQTRSGSAISGIRDTQPNSTAKRGNYLAILKEGEKRKLKEERQGVESWHEIYPGLAPRILSYNKRGESAALLIEHLPGMTFEQVLLSGSDELLSECLEQLSRTLLSVWQETRTDKKVASGFIAQLNQRLDEVYKIHPEFQQGEKQLCDLCLPSFEQLLADAARAESRLKAPFSVYIHGDFNVDNIIYDPVERRINFIDLHRSRYMDYVQDVSVFMVSNYRLQILDLSLRRRMMAVARNVHSLAHQFAAQNNDDSFELRLAFGLARSFTSSTRFILDKSHARSMFLRARHLLELALSTPPESAADFKLPIKEIFRA